MVSPICCDEPTGIVMIEAIACGIPVVALNRRSVPEVAADGETGFLRDDSAALPAAIDDAGRLDPAARRRHVEQYFGAAAMAAGYERIYGTVQETGGLAFKRRATG